MGRLLMSLVLGVEQSPHSAIRCGLLGDASSAECGSRVVSPRYHTPRGNGVFSIQMDSNESRLSISNSFRADSSSFGRNLILERLTEFGQGVVSALALHLPTHELIS